MPVHEALRDVTAEAWFPSTQGQEKYRRTAQNFRRDVESDKQYVFRAAIVYFTSALEEYFQIALNEKPYGMLSTLIGVYAERHRQGTVTRPVNLVYGIRADLCYRIRNLIIHQPSVPLASAIPDNRTKMTAEIRATLDPADSRYLGPRDAAHKAAVRAYLSLPENARRPRRVLVEQAWNHIVRAAERGVSRAANAGKQLPIEFFVMLYTFTNYRTLVQEIESTLVR
jgi:hypothetical protein